MKKNISVISMDSVLQEWLLQKPVSYTHLAGGKERKRLPISYYLSGGSKNDIAKRKNR